MALIMEGSRMIFSASTEKMEAANTITPSKASVLLFFTIYLLGFQPSFAQEPAESNKKKIELKNADRLEYDETRGVKARKLIGNVVLKHEEVFLYCDSAYLYTDKNSLDAYSNVRIKQGDTLNLYGDTLYYDGNTKIARIRNNIHLIEDDMELLTDFLDYDRENDFAHYRNGGKLITNKDKNTLTSEIGYYYPKTKELFFKDSVVLINPDYEIRSDTLMYNTNTEVTYFHGPSTIKSDDNFIYCENGWYDTQKGLSSFNKNAYLISDKKELRGDSIFYDRNKGIGEAFRNVMIIDTLQDLIIEGNYAIHHEKDSISVVTGNTLLTQFEDGDSLFLHADTLIAAYDSTRKNRIMYAWYHVKFFKSDMQGKCDSLVFSDADSAIYMYRDPVIWQEKNQITADFIKINRNGGNIKSMWMETNAFIITEEDSLKYNQIKGNNMLGHFIENKLRTIDVKEKGKTLYYASEDNGDMIGVNKTECEDMVIRIDSSKVKNISFYTAPAARLIPMDKVVDADLKLDGFNWLHAIRPREKKDVFVWKPPVEEVENEEKEEKTVAPPTEAANPDGFKGKKRKGAIEEEKKE